MIGYCWLKEKLYFIIGQWAEYYFVLTNDLAISANNLMQIREAELFYRIKFPLHLRNFYWVNAPDDHAKPTQPIDTTSVVLLGNDAYTFSKKQDFGIPIKTRGFVTRFVLFGQMLILL